MAEAVTTLSEGLSHTAQTEEIRIAFQNKEKGMWERYKIINGIKKARLAFPDPPV